MKLSIIIPCFNCESTIINTISSIVNSIDINEYEVICINDASVDNTLNLLRKIELNFPNIIKIFNLKLNMGVSHARNCGLINANGDWILFVDSDDIASLSNIELIIDTSKSSDFLIFNHLYLDLLPFNYGVDSESLNKEGIINLTKKFLRNPVGNSIITHCWAKIYQRSFLNQNSIRFDENLSIYEDVKFVSECLFHANQLGIVNQTIYTHYPSHGLGMNFEKYPLDFMPALKMLSEIITDEPNSNYFKSAYTAFIAKTLMLAFGLPPRRLYLFIKAIKINGNMIFSSDVKNKLLRTVFLLRIYKVKPLFYFLILKFNVLQRFFGLLRRNNLRRTK